MKKIALSVASCLFFPFIFSCNSQQQKKTQDTVDSATNAKAGNGSQVKLPEPYATSSAHNFSNIIGWPEGKTPIAPSGFTVTKFADGLYSPRWIYVAPNGDIFVAESNTENSFPKKVRDVVIGRSKSVPEKNSLNCIVLFRGVTPDGKAAQRYTFLTGLNQNFGMLVLNGYFYEANTDGIWRFPYKTGETGITAAGQKILDLPKGGYNNHWTRNLLANADGSKIYVTVGSGSNNAEHGMENEVRRANILEINPDGSGERIYASGLRNPVGLGWAPGTHTLWAAVNERDNLGDELVPDYMTSVKEGGFYGWPYSYYGQHPDPRMKDNARPDLVKTAIVPDVPLGSHTASLGLAFDDKNAFPAKYKNGAFIGQHGSWNRSTLAGYKVAFVPFKNGKPSGTPEDFLTGFIANADKSEVYGRPVGVAFLQDGSMLVADDGANVIWRVSANK